MKFLHIADVHLGCTRYQLPESPRDFYDAWVDVLQRYGVDERVDLVIMCGDFFHKKSVPPETMNYAVEGLTMMQEAGIPVIAIEGNHDQRPTDNEFSWLRSLSKWGLVKLLEPTRVEVGIDRSAVVDDSDKTPKGVTLTYEAWDERLRRGGFIDVGRCRVFGSDWYGASGNVAIPMLTRAIKAHRREGAFHILMLHTDVEGHQVHPIPALSIEALSQLKSAVEYVGLGHTHRHYEIDNWAFNPGSIEVTNITEFRETRGAFVVEVADDNSFTSRHVDEYHHRPFQQLSYEVGIYNDAKELTAGVVEKAAVEARPAEDRKPRPIIEVALRGQLGFSNSTLELAKIRDTIREMTGALHVRIKNHTVPADYSETVETADNDDRERLERRVIEDLVVRDTRYNERHEDISEAVIGAKRMALSDDEPARIAEFIGVKSSQKR
jgi:DNA repair exonuclease SbcCD nuclease subunit